MQLFLTEMHLKKKGWLMTQVEVNHRAEVIRELLEEINSKGDTIDEGKFNALGMLICDAMLDNDTESLNQLTLGLQHLIAKYANYSEDKVTENRLLGLLDVVFWGAIRCLPKLTDRYAELLTKLFNDGPTHHGDLAKGYKNSAEFDPMLNFLTDEGCIVVSIDRRYDTLDRSSWIWDITPRGRAAVNHYNAKKNELTRTGE